MAYGKKTTFNDALRYGRLSAAYSGTPTGKPGKGYGAQAGDVRYGMPHGGDGAAAEDYMGVFMRAAGLMYGAVRGMQDSARGSVLGNYGPALGGMYGSGEQCEFPSCPHHGLGVQKGARSGEYGGLERKANDNDSYGNARR